MRRMAGMAAPSLEGLLEQLREHATARGASLQELLAEALANPDEQASRSSEEPRQWRRERRSRPPSRLSPSPPRSRGARLSGGGEGDVAGPQSSEESVVMDTPPRDLRSGARRVSMMSAPAMLSPDLGAVVEGLDRGVGESRAGGVRRSAPPRARQNGRRMPRSRSPRSEQALPIARGRVTRAAAAASRPPPTSRRKAASRAVLSARPQDGSAHLAAQERRGRITAAAKRGDPVTGDMTVLAQETTEGSLWIGSDRFQLSRPRSIAEAGVGGQIRIPVTSGGALPGRPALGSPLAAVHMASGGSSLMAARSSPTTVWIIGHSYIHWAAKRAAQRPLGRNLGFPEDLATIQWIGIRGLRWAQVVGNCRALAGLAAKDVVLVVHAGGNDLGLVRSIDLVREMKRDLASCFTIFRGLVLVFSEIVSRPRWEELATPRALDKARKRVNREISKFVGELGGVSVRHTELEGDNRNVIRRDGVHLTDIGLDIFLMGLQAGVQEALSAGGRRGGR